MIVRERKGYFCKEIIQKEREGESVWEQHGQKGGLFKV